jgi:hypothetical protein
MIKQVFDCMGGKGELPNLSGVIFTGFGHFSFVQIAVLNENMTKFTCLL